MKQNKSLSKEIKNKVHAISQESIDLAAKSFSEQIKNEAEEIGYRVYYDWAPGREEKSEVSINFEYLRTPFQRILFNIGKKFILSVPFLRIFFLCGGPTKKKRLDALFPSFLLVEEKKIPVKQECAWSGFA